MSGPDEGGPAFPVVADEVAQSEAWGGMTLRDYFAAKAMAGFIGVDTQACQFGAEAIRSYAVGAYAVADAMLAVRDE